MSSESADSASALVRLVERFESLASLAQHPVMRTPTAALELSIAIRQTLAGDCPELLTADGSPTLEELYSANVSALICPTCEAKPGVQCSASNGILRPTPHHARRVKETR